MEDKYLMKISIENEPDCIGTFVNELDVGTKVVVLVDNSSYLGEVNQVSLANQQDDLSIYNQILRVASKDDIARHLKNKEIDEKLLPQIQKEADKLNLDMKVFKVSSSLDKTKCLIMYTSDNRVDFRDLLKILAKLIKARIEMRQVGSRDKAKVVGGLGICGLKLCCSTFLNVFDGISISMAKNQMLAINIPKLSGQCGKLICCLKYEDEAYSKLHPFFPKIGTKVTYEGKENSVSGVNMLLKNVTLYDGEKYSTFALEDFNKIQKGIKLERKEEFVSELSLNSTYSASFGKDISSTSELDLNKKNNQNSNNFENRNNNKNKFNNNSKFNNHRYNQNNRYNRKNKGKFNNQDK